MTQPLLYEVRALHDVAVKLFVDAGFERDKADSISEILIEADLMGHSTHGLALAPWYLDLAASGGMTKSGEPSVLSDRGACVSWDGRRLPGTWLVSRAIDLGVERAPKYGTVTIAIAESGHIGALAAYMPRATDQGMMAIIASSSPSVATVAPFGGIKAVMTPDPIAAGIPTTGDPILLDISASITTNNKARQLLKEGKKFPRPWAIDAQGNPSDDPNVVLNEGGTILPVGGLDHGHKGYGLALLVESLTQGLSGAGRSSKPKGQTNAVFVQVIDPSAFAGQEAFTRETSFLVEACRASPPRAGADRVRVPGESAMRNKRSALERGVPLAASIVTGLLPRLEKAGLALPAPR